MFKNETGTKNIIIINYKENSSWRLNDTGVDQLNRIINELTL